MRGPRYTAASPGRIARPSGPASAHAEDVLAKDRGVKRCVTQIGWFHTGAEWDEAGRPQELAV